MMFVFYSVALTLLAFAYEYPDLALLIVLLATARLVLKH
jgi:hypothetical protein